MTPDEEIDALTAEVTRQREQIAVLVSRVRKLEARGAMARRALVRGALVVLFAAGIGLVVAWSLGAFESRLTYWRERGHDCGSVDYGPYGVLVNQGAAQRAVACFAAADTRCEAAVLTRNVGSTDTDTIVTETFVVEPRDGGGGCDVGLRYSFGILASPGVTTRDMQCDRVTNVDGVLTIGGCQGFSDITMP